MNRLIQDVSALLSELDKRNKRERLLLLLTGFVVLIIVSAQFFYIPMEKESDRLHQKKQNLQTRITSLQTRANEIVKGRRQDPDKKFRRQIKHLQGEIEDLDQRLHQLTKDLISSKDMARILENMLRSSHNLEIMSLENLKPVALDWQKNKGQGSKSGQEPSVPNVYRHPLRITFRGSYLHTLDYLRELEHIEKRFFWDQMGFKVKDYPRARISFTVHTLSLDKRWLGL